MTGTIVITSILNTSATVRVAKFLTPTYHGNAEHDGRTMPLDFMLELAAFAAGNRELFGSLPGIGFSWALATAKAT